MTLAEVPPSNIKVIEMIPDDSKPENVELENRIDNTKTIIHCSNNINV